MGTCKNKNCMGSCIHNLMRDIMERHEWKDDEGNVIGVINEHVGYEHYCDKNPEGYAEWHERNKDNTYEVYKYDSMPCYEPTEFAKMTDNMIGLMEEILEKVNKD